MQDVDKVVASFLGQVVNVFSIEDRGTAKPEELMREVYGNLLFHKNKVFELKIRENEDAIILGRQQVSHMFTENNQYKSNDKVHDLDGYCNALHDLEIFPVILNKLGVTKGVVESDFIKKLIFNDGAVFDPTSRISSLGHKEVEDSSNWESNIATLWARSIFTRVMKSENTQQGGRC